MSEGSAGVSARLMAALGSSPASTGPGDSAGRARVLVVDPGRRYRDAIKAGAEGLRAPDVRGEGGLLRDPQSGVVIELLAEGADVTGAVRPDRGIE